MVTIEVYVSGEYSSKLRDEFDVDDTLAPEKAMRQARQQFLEKFNNNWKSSTLLGFNQNLNIEVPPLKSTPKGNYDVDKDEFILIAKNQNMKYKDIAEEFNNIYGESKSPIAIRDRYYRLSGKK